LAFHSGREADHSPPSSAEVKEWVELYLHFPNTPSWRGAQLGGAQGQLYLYLYVKGPMRLDRSKDMSAHVSSCNNYNLNALTPAVWKLWR
jgi:hypothetical protein